MPALHDRIHNFKDFTTLKNVPLLLKLGNQANPYLLVPGWFDLILPLKLFQQMHTAILLQFFLRVEDCSSYTTKKQKPCHCLSLLKWPRIFTISW